MTYLLVSIVSCKKRKIDLVSLAQMAHNMRFAQWKDETSPLRCFSLRNVQVRRKERKALSLPEDQLAEPADGNWGLNLLSKIELTALVALSFGEAVCANSVPGTVADRGDFDLEEGICSYLISPGPPLRDGEDDGFQGVTISAHVEVIKTPFGQYPIAYLAPPVGEVFRPIDFVLNCEGQPVLSDENLEWLLEQLVVAARLTHAKYAAFQETRVSSRRSLDRSPEGS